MLFGLAAGGGFCNTRRLRCNFCGFDCDFRFGLAQCRISQFTRHRRHGHACDRFVLDARKYSWEPNDRTKGLSNAIVGRAFFRFVGSKPVDHTPISIHFERGPCVARILENGLAVHLCFGDEPGTKTGHLDRNPAKQHEQQHAEPRTDGEAFLAVFDVSVRTCRPESFTCQCICPLGGFAPPSGTAPGNDPISERG